VRSVEAVLFGVFGLVFGSFLTVLVHRTPRRESVVGGRSRCPACHATIGARDNVPVLSWMLLRGRCRNCGERISFEYPLTELASAAVFVGAAVAFRDLYLAAVMAVFLAILLALALIDLRHKILPNAIVYPSLVVFALALGAGAAIGRHVELSTAGLGLLVFGGALLTVAVIAEGSMGMGDVKLAALIGLVLGSQGLRDVGVAAGVAILSAGVGGVAALAAGQSRKSAIPFGPYLVIGAIAATFWGASLARAYLWLVR